MLLLAVVGSQWFCRARFVDLLVIYIAATIFAPYVQSIRNTIPVPSRNNNPFSRESKRQSLDRNSPHRSSDSRQASSGTSIPARERNLDYIFRPNGRSIVQFAPLQGQLFSPIGRPGTLAAYGLAPAPANSAVINTAAGNVGESGESMVPSPGPAGCTHAAGSCWSANFAPAPTVVINRGPTSTFTNLNSRFAAFSANIPSQQTGKFSLLLKQASAGRAYRNKLAGLLTSTTTPAPTPPPSTTPPKAPTEVILLGSDGTLQSLTSAQPAAVQSPEDFQITLRTLFGW